MRQRVNLRSMVRGAGTVLAGLGMFFLYENLAGAMLQIATLLGANGSQVIGIVPASILVGLQASHTGGLIHHALVSCWPLLPVTLGVVLTKNESNVANLPPKNPRKRV
jgi:hypothetical protein